MKNTFKEKIISDNIYEKRIKYWYFEEKKIINMSIYLPDSKTITTNQLSAIFNKTTATYKYFWFLGILDFVEKGKNEIYKEDLFLNMIVRAWHPISYFKLNFGIGDRLGTTIQKIKLDNKIPDLIDQQKLYLFLKQHVSTKEFAFLNKYVPYKFLTPWFETLPDKEIEELSQNYHKNCPYALYKHKVVINPRWTNYLTENNKILKEFCFWNLSTFLQQKNPNIPNVSSKIIPEFSRNPLMKQRNEFWKLTFEETGYINCIFTSKKLFWEENNFAIDHFIPYSFLAHDLIWNLIPIDKTFNSSKSNKLPDLNKYFEDFCYLQKTAFEIYKLKTPNGKYLEEYATIFHNDNFDRIKLKETLEPLIMIAHNNGFSIL